MGSGSQIIPPPPAGFTFDASPRASSIPAAPAGFTFDAPPEKPSLASDALKYSPVGAVQSLADAIRDPKHALSELLAQPSENAKLLQKAKDSYKAGDLTGAAAHFLNYLIPGGGALEDAGEDFANGDPVRGTLKTAGLASTVLAGAKAPAALEAATEAPKPSVPGSSAVSTVARKIATKAIASTTGVPTSVINAVLDALKSGESDVPAAVASRPSVPAPVGDRPPPFRVPETTAPPAPDATPIPSEGLPSGRLPGGAQNQPAPQPPVVRAPAARVEISPRQLPDATPIRGDLPSGRVPGGIQNQVPMTEAAPAVAPTYQGVPIPALNEMAVRSGFKDFSEVPREYQPIVANATKVELAKQAAPPSSIVQSQAPSPQPVQPPAPAVPQPPAPTAIITKADIAKRALAEEMLKNGSATPEMLSNPAVQPEPVVPDAKALKTLMRDLPPGVPKALADANYAGNQEPTQAAAVYEAAGRAAKAQKLSQMLHDDGLTSTKVAKWTPDQWSKAIDDQGMPHDFSLESRGEVVKMLRKLERTVPKK